MTYLLLACGLVMLASLSGKLVVWRHAGRFFERNLHLMVSFAAGVFLIFAWQLSSEVVEHVGGLEALAWIAGGAVAIGLVCLFLPHREAPDTTHNHKHLDAHRMLVTDSIHNAGDGIVLAASFVLSPMLGVAATVSVLVHEVVQEVAEFFVLRDAGYSMRRALLLNFVTSSAIVVGALGGYLLLDVFGALEGPLLGVAAGGVLSVVLYDLIPHSLQDARTRSNMLHHLLWFVLGCLLMFAVVMGVPHVEAV